MHKVFSPRFLSKKIDCNSYGNWQVWNLYDINFKVFKKKDISAYEEHMIHLLNALLGKLNVNCNSKQIHIIKNVIVITR